MADQVLLPLRFDGQLWAISRAPFDIDQGWQKWLGLRADTFRDSNLFLLATAPSQTPAVLDAEHQALERSVRLLYVALTVIGLRPSQAGLIIQGVRLPEPRGFEIQSVSETSRIFGLARRPSVSLDERSFVTAAQMATSIEKLNAREERPRLLKGLRSLVSGLETNYGEERLHAFVRALDAVVKLPPGKGMAEFAARCITFAGRNTATEKTLRELYRLRNAAEHVNDFKAVLSDYIAPERESVALQRVLQSEVLASTVYTRILSSDRLTERFSDNAWLDELWSRPADQRDELWNGTVDIEGLERPQMDL